MVNSLVKGGGKMLSADVVSSLLGGIVQSRASTPIMGGKPLLRLLKSGAWVFGQSDDPVQVGSQWAINPLSIKHGYCCWSDSPNTNVKNELLGEVMVPIGEHKPAQQEPIGDYAWKEQRAFEARCVLGDDDGTEVLYKTSSIGGMRGFDNFLAQLSEQLQEDPTHPVAIVQLEVSAYQHSKFGQIFTPVFDIVQWATMTGETAQLDGDGGDEVQGNGADAGNLQPKAAKPAPKTKEPLNTAPQASTRPGAPPRRQRPSTRA